MKSIGCSTKLGMFLFCTCVIDLRTFNCRYNIGVRIIDDFFAKNTSVGRCGDLKAVAEVLARQVCFVGPVVTRKYTFFQGFKNYLGIAPTIGAWSTAGDEFSLYFDANPLSEFVELPPDRCVMPRQHVFNSKCEHMQEAVALLASAVRRHSWRHGSGAY